MAGTPPSQGDNPYAPQFIPQPVPREPGGSYPPPGAPACRICGAMPAMAATVRGHQGIVVLMRFPSLRGPFCRGCGLATVRGMSARTLWQGWWSPLSIVITPITLLLNLGPWRAFRELAAPAAGFRPPLAPGKPLTRRPEAMLFLVPMVLMAVVIPVLLVTGPLTGDDSAGARTLPVGACVHNEGDWSQQDLRVTDCGAPDAQYEVTRRLEQPGDRCGDGEYYADLQYGPGGTTVSCLRAVR